MHLLSSPPLSKVVVQRCSVKKDALENFAKFTGKHLCQSLFFNATLLKKRLWYRSFPMSLVTFLRTLFYRTPLVAASALLRKLLRNVALRYFLRSLVFLITPLEISALMKVLCVLIRKYRFYEVHTHSKHRNS